MATVGADGSSPTGVGQGGRQVESGGRGHGRPRKKGKGIGKNKDWSLVHSRARVDSGDEALFSDKGEDSDLQGALTTPKTRRRSPKARGRGCQGTSWQRRPQSATGGTTWLGLGPDYI